MKSMDTTSMPGEQSLEDLQRIDGACTSFERALQRGETPSIADFLANAGPEVRSRLLRELLSLEMEYRARNGESATLEEFRERFPNDGALVKYLYLEHFVPARLADFSIQRLLGRGAFGHVYQGWDARLTRHVALKVFRRDPTAAPRGGSLRAEARTVAQLRHPGIVAVYAVQQDEDGDEFLVLEFVEGTSLEDLLRNDRPSASEATGIVLQVVQALQHAHQQGLVHRDLKPANILLDAARRPRITDFGLALHLATTPGRPEIAGTLAYMAPEQASGETHRLDARTDLWAVGVILYRSLSGQLPFSGNSNQELLEAIRYGEPPELRSSDSRISPELNRIVRRCLAKRMSDRYQSAAELAEDLEVFLHARPDQSTPAATGGESLAAVVPKGLRCFDANDRDFFLSLVPGARDRNGVPATVLFWERHLQEEDPHETFRVGLLYGPSGCGKSSLIRAGILPRLPRSVRVLVIEGARDETELALIRELRRHFPQLSSELALPEMLRELREGPWLVPGEKLVLVFDQFEQWLHGWRQDQASQLVEMLRQCDGARVQALILVRDDFWMPATRLFQQLDVPLVEGFNSSAVDLFDRPHAIKVLAAFGVAYRRVNPQSWQQEGDTTRFLERAVDELSEGGWVIPVRLCIFAEMVKSRPWTVATLDDVGGAQGLGAAFLEETFDGRSASPMYRLHRQAARQVLERLLPPAGTVIRGHLVSERELQEASGYEQRPADFAALLRCLDHELRLITPSDTATGEPEPAEAGSPELAAPRLYQLTHDFLVSAIGGWLNQSRRRTMRGRAELRLREYADAYAARPDGRQLPSWWDWLRFAALTRASSWRPAERQIMRDATRYHALRGAAVIGALGLVAALLYSRMSIIHADGLVDAIATSDSRDLPQAAARVAEYRTWTRPRLKARLDNEPRESEQRVRLLAGAVALGEPSVEELSQRMLAVDPPLSVAVAEILARNQKLAGIEPRLWSVAGDPEKSSDERLRACAALAHLEPAARAEKWKAVADDLAPLMLRDIGSNPRNFSIWVEAIAPAQEWLVPPLEKAFADGSSAEAQRVLAANILARYAADDSARLVQLALRSRPRQFEVVTRTLGDRAEAKRAELQKLASEKVPDDASEEAKDALARRQANAILLLRDLGDDELLWPALRHRPDPRLRSFLVNHWYQVPRDADAWQRRLDGETDPGIRQALVLLVGTAASAPLSDAERDSLAALLMKTYRDDADSGVHAAAEWALRQLGCQKEIDSAIAELSQAGIRDGYSWYVTRSKITMVIITAPGPMQLGSPTSEPGRDESNETVWTADVDWSYAISDKEITQAQYLEVCPDYKEAKNEFSPSPDCPVNAISWIDAVQFCRLLSERDGVPEAEMAVLKNASGQARVDGEYLDRTGYRLPTEVEWEVACRAGTVTPRYFGNATDLLPAYCWYIDDSQGTASGVGRLLPNPIGMFDMLGNVSEWCLDAYAVQPLLHPKPSGIAQIASFTTRGSEYSSNARMVRAANRKSAAGRQGGYSRGFRIVHTVRNRAVKP